LDAILQPERISHMKSKHFWLASVLVAAAALSSTTARADEIITNGSGEGCTNCGTASKFHLSIFHKESSCEACGGHAWLSWHPGQCIASAHACVDAMIQSLLDCFHKPTCAGAKANQPIPPQYLYNPYARSPRDYFMNDR
jgi:hypothetical protein